MKPLTSPVAAIGREPTPDEVAGMAWWNELSDTARVFWLDQASVGRRIWDVSAADAWAAYQNQQALESLATMQSALRRAFGGGTP